MPHCVPATEGGTDVFSCAGSRVKLGFSINVRVWEDVPEDRRVEIDDGVCVFRFERLPVGTQLFTPGKGTRTTTEEELYPWGYYNKLALARVKFDFGER